MSWDKIPGYTVAVGTGVDSKGNCRGISKYVYEDDDDDDSGDGESFW